MINKKVTYMQHALIVNIKRKPETVTGENKSICFANLCALLHKIDLTPAKRTRIKDLAKKEMGL